jgi:hypothetical protein
MNEFPGEAILHIEADVWLSPNFPMARFLALGEGIAYPLKSDTEGIASTFYVGSVSSMQKFLSFCQAKFAENGFSTDVSILGNFWREDEMFYNLPSGIPSQDFYHNWVSSKVTQQLSKNLDVYHGLFDASTFGIWFTGEDPRNAWGFRVLFKNQNHPINLSGWQIELENNRVFLAKETSRIELFSLHIHSKDLRFFNLNTWERRIAQISNYSNTRVVREFVPGLTVSIFLSTFFYYGRLFAHKLKTMLK